MASILTRHVSHWACLRFSGSVYTRACSSSWQYPATLHSHWRGVTNIPQATINNLINSMRRRCVALCEANGGHTRYWLVFGPPPGPPLQYSKTARLKKWPFIVSSLRHTCVIIMLSNQHLDMPHLWGGWIISAKEKCSLTQIYTDLWTIFERNRPFSSAHEKWGQKQMLRL